MKNKLGFKIYLTQKCFLEKKRCGELLEKLEDAIASLLTSYGLEGKIGDNLTGNIIVFPLAPPAQEYRKYHGKDCVIIESSHGTFYAGPITGEVVGKEICCDKQTRPDSCNNIYTQINTFDFEEWKNYYEKGDPDGFIDILDLGYWLNDGVYIPAVEDHRVSVSQ